MRTLRRIAALAWKESLQLARDRATLGMLLGVPLVQVLLFGFAIELSPRPLAVTLVAAEPGTAARVERWLQVERIETNVQRAENLELALRELARGRTLVVVDADTRPVTVYIDATDPVLATQATTGVERLRRILADGGDADEERASALVVRQMYNPGGRTQPFLVSGLVGLILTMSLVMMSALSVARERERGTFEGLLALDVGPAELAAGKLVPYLLLGMLQAVGVLVVATLAFGVSITGSGGLLAATTAVFAIANLLLGFLFSNLAAAQMPAMQMTFFFFLPSSLLSGFMFPFGAMPGWARGIGEALPLTHYLRVVRGVAFRGVDAGFVLAELLHIGLFAIIVGIAAMLACSRSLHRGGL